MLTPLSQLSQLKTAGWFGDVARRVGNSVATNTPRGTYAKHLGRGALAAGALLPFSPTAAGVVGGGLALGGMAKSFVTNRLADMRHLKATPSNVAPAAPDVITPRPLREPITMSQRPLSHAEQTVQDAHTLLGE
jgi:hypothetical protein